MPLSKSENDELVRLSNLGTSRTFAQTKRMRDLIARRQADAAAQPGSRASKAKANKPAQQGPGYGLREYEAKALEPTPGLQQPLLDPRRLQELLRDAGYYTGRIDGIIGPLTNKALDAWVAEGSPDLEQKAAERLANQPFGGGGGIDVGGGGGGTGTPSSPAAPAMPAGPPAATLSPQAFRTRVLAELPAYAAFLDIPDLVPIIQARLDDRISTQEFAAQVKETNWYRTTPERARTWLGLYAIDPATAERQIDEQAVAVRQRANAYFVPIADVTAREWARKALSGEVPEAAVDEYIKEQAKSLFPSLAAAIDAGVTVEQYADPYKQIAAQTLELPTEAINFQDAKWSRALNQVDKDGNRTSMSLYDWQNLLRTDAAYGFDRTNQARTQATQIADDIGRTFGKVA